MAIVGELLWTPGPERIARSQLTAYVRWLATERGLSFDSYASLWQWSVTEVEAFWQSLWDYFRLDSSAPVEGVLGSRQMPGARWFPGARLNYAQHVLRHERGDETIVLHLSERQPLTEISWASLAGRVRILATQLRKLGVKPGDRVVANLPNIPEAMIAMLATTAIGAVWSSCGPDFGTRGVLDRFAQLEPKVLLCVDGYQYGGKPFNHRAEIEQVITQLVTLEHVIYLPHLDPADRKPLSANTLLWDELFDHPPVPAEGFVYEQMPFDAPLWILFSSGTTGLPKAICHSHGGIVIEQLKALHFQMDLLPRDRLFFFTTTGWMMWNFLVSAPLNGICPVLYDGNPAWPGVDVLWRMVEQSGTKLFGASPTYQAILEKAGFEPSRQLDLSKLETVMLAGSPVTAECTKWFYDHVKSDLWVATGSGGTDVCTGFVGGSPTLPVYAGEIQTRLLGVAAYALNEHGEKVVNEVGELVITAPMPSMPVCFWNDPHGRKYFESYFAEFPGLWRHGDFFRVNERGGCFVLGRSDATLNRHGVRIGTAEVYRTLAGLPEIEESLIVNLDLSGGRFFMPLFVKLRPGVVLDPALVDKIRSTLRREYSPRHVPDKILAVDDIPLTLTGKKLEVPVRRILLGLPPEQAANRDAVANPAALDYFIDYAKLQTDYVL